MTDTSLAVSPVVFEVDASTYPAVVVAYDPATTAVVVEVEQASQVVTQDVIAVEVGQLGAGSGTGGDPAGTAAALMAAHVAAADPHPQYLDNGEAIDGGNF